MGLSARAEVARFLGLFQPLRELATCRDFRSRESAPHHVSTFLGCPLLACAGLDTTSMATPLMLSTTLISTNQKSATAGKACRRGTWGVIPRDSDGSGCHRKIADRSRPVGGCMAYTVIRNRETAVSSQDASRVFCWASIGRAHEPHETGAVKRVLFSTAAALAVTLSAGSALADTSAETFNKTCAGCHAAGGNVVSAGKSLFPMDLQRNGVNDADTIYNLIYGGKNKMPGYSQDCQPKGQCTFGARLSDEEVRGLAEYVVEQSKLDWK